MAEQVHYRVATAADAVVLAQMYLEARKSITHYAPLVHSDGDVHCWVREVLLPEQEIWLAEAAGKIIGMMATAPGWLHQLYCKPGYTNQGIGTALLNVAKMRESERLDLYTFQPNTGARRFYERHGFTAIKFGDGSDNDEGVPDVLYRWAKQ